jgi:hypothetical protein
MEFAKFEFELSRKSEDGASLGDHAESARRQLEQLGSAARPKVLADTPEIPPALEYLWRWWHELVIGRASGGFGPSHVSWAELGSWCRLSDTVLEPWEARCLMDLDTLWLAAHAKKPPKQ